MRAVLKHTMLRDPVTGSTKTALENRSHFLWHQLSLSELASFHTLTNCICTALARLVQHPSTRVCTEVRTRYFSVSLPHNVLPPVKYHHKACGEGSISCSVVSRVALPYRLGLCYQYWKCRGLREFYNWWEIEGTFRGNSESRSGPDSGPSLSHQPAARAAWLLCMGDAPRGRVSRRETCCHVLQHLAGSWTPANPTHWRI